MSGSASYWSSRIGDDAVAVYSPTMRRDAYLSPAEAHLLSLPEIQAGRVGSYRSLLPRTMYRSVSGLWRAVNTLTKLGLLQRAVRAASMMLRAVVAPVRTLVRRISTNVEERNDVPVLSIYPRTRVRTRMTAHLEAMHVGTLLANTRFAGLIE